MAKIAFMGLGAMGARMAARLLAAGHAVTVWNRTPAAAQALTEAGASIADTPREAARGADMVLSMLRDDDVSRQTWLDPDNGALAGMAPGALAIESSTLTPDWVRALGRAAAALDIPLLEAPVAGSRPAAENGQLVFLVGGEADRLTVARPVLEAMGCAIHHIGPLGSGALAKLATNTLLGVHVAALAEVIGLLDAGGADVEATLKAVSATPVWAPVDHYLSSTMIAGNFAPQFPVALLDKDFGYAIDVAGGARQVPLAQTVKERLEMAIAAGLGDLNMTALVQLNRDQPFARTPSGRS